jgi:hypothetical protein
LPGHRATGAEEGDHMAAGRGVKLDRAAVEALEGKGLGGADWFGRNLGCRYLGQAGEAGDGQSDHAREERGVGMMKGNAALTGKQHDAIPGH